MSDIVFTSYEAGHRTGVFKQYPRVKEDIQIYPMNDIKKTAE